MTLHNPEAGKPKDSTLLVSDSKKIIYPRLKRQIYAVSIASTAKKRIIQSKFVDAAVVSVWMQRSLHSHREWRHHYIQTGTSDTSSIRLVKTILMHILFQEKHRFSKDKPYNRWNSQMKLVESSSWDPPSVPAPHRQSYFQANHSSPIIEAPIPIPSICLFQVVKAHSSEKVDSITFFSLPDEIRFGKDEANQRVSRMQPIIQLTWSSLSRHSTWHAPSSEDSWIRNLLKKCYQMQQRQNQKTRSQCE